jgi:hypothetical protein
MKCSAARVRSASTSSSRAHARPAADPATFVESTNASTTSGVAGTPSGALTVAHFDVVAPCRCACSITAGKSIGSAEQTKCALCPAVNEKRTAPGDHTSSSPG